MDLAISAYIERVNLCSCGEGVIHLFKGAIESDILKQRDKLLIFLKGTKEAKRRLKCEDPVLYATFDMVWDVRNRHMIRGLPKQYLFVLVCCFEDGCPHPKCKKDPGTDPLWFTGGPPIKHLPLPKLDPNRPWGNQNCNECAGFCTGHYLLDSLTDTGDVNDLSSALQPPSVILKEKFKEYPSSLDPESFVTDVAKTVLLSPDDVRLWFDHLQTIEQNRKKGAEKAAATRRAKTTTTTTTVTYCGGNCGFIYESDSVVDFWIACDVCDMWYCCLCEGLSEPPEEESYVCTQCNM